MARCSGLPWIRWINAAAIGVLLAVLLEDCLYKSCEFNVGGVSLNLDYWWLLSAELSMGDLSDSAHK